MTRFWMIALLAASVATAAPAGEKEDSIQAVIADQIGAFQRSDLVTAFSYASPAIQGFFRTPERFGKMVAGGYPMILNPARWQMLELEETESGLVQTVFFEASDGRLYEAEYEMIPVRGDWRINGVRLRQIPGASI